MNGHFLSNRVVIRGAGEMASGVIRRLFVSGFEVIALEQPAPDCYAETVYQDEATVEEITAVLAASPEEIAGIIARQQVPVLVDPRAESLPFLRPLALIDARMLKIGIDLTPEMAPVVVGLGPGFIAGQNCHAAVETNRGFDLGRVVYHGSPQADTCLPAPVDGVGADRVLRAPADGKFRSPFAIGAAITAGQTVGQVAGRRIAGRIGGIIRGLIRDGAQVTTRQKIGDIDPRGVKEHCFKISEKANAIAGGVLEAVLALRGRLEQ